jgi:trk system potassium uptake protein TrkH
VRYLVILRILAAVVGLSGLIMVPPLLLALALDDGNAGCFAHSLIACVSIGAALWIPARHARQELRVRDGFLVVTLTWVLVSLAGALPFMLGPTQLPLARAYFESASGLTTTGATVLTGLDALPQSMLFYRQSLCFLGGMGIVILAVAILPMLRVGGSQLFRSESTGPVKDARLTPRIAETARALWLVYVGLNLLCAFAYWGAGMSVFDAVGHAFATLATTGFSTHDANFAYFDSPLLQVIATVFMFVASVNFALHFTAFKRASSAAYFHDPELRAYLGILLAVWLTIAIGGYAQQLHGGLVATLGQAAFLAVSMLSTTGFATSGLDSWPHYALMVLLLVGFIGGCSGSTAGGVKVARVVMLFRQGAREVLQLVHPRGRFLVKMGGMNVPGAVLAAVTGFCTLYVACYVAVAIALSATGVDILTAWSAAAACLNNTGPGLGPLATEFGHLNTAATWICSFAMILGRLEVFTILVLFTPAFWRE